MQDTFDGTALNPYWTPLLLGGGRLEPRPGELRLTLPSLDSPTYADAQISDYAGLPPRAFPWRPPLRMTVQAYASGPADARYGTAGFGFWNDPFLPGRRSLPRLPRAVWFFFGGPRSRMALAAGQPGNGWKAATFDPGPLFYALLPLALPGFLLMRIPALYRRLWPLGQRVLGVAEAALPADLLAAPREYGIEWLADRVTFFVDGEPVLTTPHSPRGPLGFIAWIDNQYAVVTPQGRFGWGVTPGGGQWLALQKIVLEML